MSQKQLTQIYKLYPHFPLDKSYSLIYMDPPWAYHADKFKPNYPVLTMKELKLLPIKQIAKENCILLMWTTGPMRYEAMKLIEHYGFKYSQSMFIWNKTRNGKPASLPGLWTNTSAEEILVATRGVAKPYIREGTPKHAQVQEAEVTQHSAKPDKFVKAFADIFKLDKMESLEVFARRRVLNEFDLYGDELTPRFQPRLPGQKEVQAYAKRVRRKRARAKKSPRKEKATQGTLEHTQDRPQFSKNLSSVEEELFGEVFVIEEFLEECQEELQNELDALSEDWSRTSEIMKLFERQETRIKESTTELRLFIKKNIRLFAFNKNEFGLTDVLQHRINLERDAVPIARAPYKVAPNEENFIEKEIEMLFKLGCIEESNSQWASPIVLVKKSSGDLRMCIDYRGLNKSTVRDLFPLPRIDQMLIQVCNGKIFSKLDLKSGFWQVSVYIYDRYKTSFVSKKGTFQWKRMPFGLTNAPATFQRLMQIVLSKFLGKFCLVYIDDIIVYSNTIEEHLDHLQQVFDALAEANLKLGYDKCTFFTKDVELLGHVVSHGQYTPLKSRVEAITKIARPKDVKGIQIFLGLVNYHGQFIPNLARIAKPMRDLTKKGIVWTWGSPQEEAFQKLKVAISTFPILYIPIHGKLMILYTDFSETGVGAVLAQEVAPKEERVIEYASRTLKTHEKNYPAYKGEVLAVCWAVEKFRQYLLQAPFRLVLDNQAAVHLLLQRKSPEKLNNLQKTVLNWVLELNDYQFTPVHRAGSSHNNADALSRLEQINSIEGSFSYIDLMLTLTSHPQDLNEVEQAQQFEMNFLNWHGASEQDCCIKCNKKDWTRGNDIIYCDLCSKGIHQKCQIPKVTIVPEGPWYCYECLQLISEMDKVDITLDFALIEYLKSKTIPLEYEEVDRKALKQRAEPFYFENHRMRRKDNNALVPTITERKMLLSQIHDHKCHNSIDSMLDTLTGEYYWETMRRDVTKFVTSCPHCSQMNPKFIPNPSLNPTEKGDRPFVVVHIDLTGDLQTQVTTRKNRYLFILVDAFSKWVELYPIRDKKSSTIANCMWDFVKRFGSPTLVITNQGGEFEGEFSQLLNDMRVQFINIAPRNPQANGMAERTVQTVKRTLRRFVQSPTQDVEWDEAAQSVQLSVNTTASQTTKYTPYEIVFGRKIAYPSSVVVDAPLQPSREPTSKEIDTYVKSLKESFKTLHPRALVNIKLADERNKQYYDQRHHKQQTELKFNDMVLVKIPRPTKLGPIGKGPYQFIRYINNRLNAELADPSNIQVIKQSGRTFYSAKTFTESTSNLAKVLHQDERYKFSPEEVQFQLEVFRGKYLDT